MEIDINRMCRSCLLECSDMYQIQESAKNHNDLQFDWKDLELSIAELIMECTEVKVSAIELF